MGIRHLLTAFLWTMGLVGALLLTSEPQLDRADRMNIAISQVRELQLAEVRLDGALHLDPRISGFDRPGPTPEGGQPADDDAPGEAARGGPVAAVEAQLERARAAIEDVDPPPAPLPATPEVEGSRTGIDQEELGGIALDPQTGQSPGDIFKDIEGAIARKTRQFEAFDASRDTMRAAAATVPRLIRQTATEVARDEPEVAAALDPALRALWEDVLVFVSEGERPPAAGRVGDPSPGAGRDDAGPRASAITRQVEALTRMEGLSPATAARLHALRSAVDGLVAARSQVDDQLGAYSRERSEHLYQTLRSELETQRNEALSNAHYRGNLRLVLIGLLVLLGVQGLWGLRRRALRLEEGLEARTLALEAANAELEAEVEARRRTENELAEALKKSRAATQAKADFLANMSHEIRTPMNGVVGMTTLLLDTDMDDEQMQYISSIERSGTALLTVINDILDFSKIEAGRMDIESRPFDVHQVVRDVAGVLQPAAQGKDIRIESRVGERVPRWVLGDAVRLRQILLNLAGNAVKFTREGKVSVEVAWRGEDMLEFMVADTGIGIPAEKLRYIFDAFSQADSSTTRKFGGTGLGLAICRRLAELMRGEVHVESQVGRGSRFRVSLPMARTQAPDNAEGREERPRERVIEPVTDQIRVLLAEDNVINQRVATRLLEKLGCNVYSVDDGTGAVEQALSREFDVIFMDCQMPRMDGYAATRTLRAQGYERPIVAMTANAMPGDRERCLESGMDDYIPKPIPRGVLERVLRTWAPAAGGAGDSGDVTDAAGGRGPTTGETPIRTTPGA